jgi:uncharacterized protein YjbI with pentapeptide repeats
MANEEQLSILKQGVDVWNKWREENPNVELDLNNAYLRQADLSRANLKNANLRNTILVGGNLNAADLRNADLTEANLIQATFVETNMVKATLRGSLLQEANLDLANLRSADVGDANLSEAILSSVDFQHANLSGADLTGANLSFANLRHTQLRATKFQNTQFYYTVLADDDFSGSTHLDQVDHHGPSTLGVDTIQISEGGLPEVFLRGCGLSDWEIESTKLCNPNLSNQEIDEILRKMHDLRVSRALQISSLFISYSHGDSTFVDKLEGFLNEEGVRFWRDKHDAKSGRLEKQIDRAMRLNPTVLLVLSEHSVKSDWVEHEVRTARELEKEMKRDVLCPVALDDSWKTSPWPKRVTEQVTEYNILDFSTWKDDAQFENTFNKLIDGLELFYK